MESDEMLWNRHLAAYSAADALYRQGKIRAAIPAFKAALALAPTDSDTLWALGDCYSEAGRARKAELSFRKAWLLAPYSKRGDLLYNIANALFDQRRPQAALILYRRVPRHSSAHSLARRNALLAARMAANSSRPLCGRNRGG